MLEIKWGELKALVDSHEDVTDDSRIILIDIEGNGEEPTVCVEPTGIVVTQ